MPRPLRVFLCHASQDKPAVRNLHRYLTQRGAKPWLDQEDLLPGEDWQEEIPNAIFSSDVILVCLSKNSVNKEGMVQKEISFALDKALEKPGKIFIIPLKLEECDVPGRLSRYQWLDYYRPDGRKRLLMGLNKRVTELGGEVSPVIMEDSRQRTPRSSIPKPEIKQKEQIAFVPPKEESKEEPKEETTSQISPHPLNVEQRENKPVQKKPFTKILDPSSLSPARVERSVSAVEARSEHSKNKPVSRVANPTYKRILGIGGIVFVFLLFAALGGNYIFNNLPQTKIPTVTPSVTSQPLTSTATKVPSTSTPAITPTPTLGIGSTMISEKDGMVLVYVPEGEFTMGSNSGGDDEKPEHQIALDAFWIDQTEVTNKMYAQCVNARPWSCDRPDQTKSFTRSNYFGNSEFDNYPVLYVSWNMANTYCSRVGRRLPTESEWEKAARGPNGNIYPWGNEAPNENLLNYNGNVGDTKAVGNYPAGTSMYGTLDMAGNVWEWVADWYGDAYFQNSPFSNPLGPSSGIYRVLRGGSWNNDANGVRSSNRDQGNPSRAGTLGSIGFRCASSP